MPAIAAHTINYRTLEIVVIPTQQAPILLEKLFHFIRFLRLCRSMMSDSIFFELVVKVLIEFAKLFDPVGDTVSEVFVSLGFLVALAIDFKKSFVVGSDYVDA